MTDSNNPQSGAWEGRDVGPDGEPRIHPTEPLPSFRPGGQASGVGNQHMFGNWEAETPEQTSRNQAALPAQTNASAEVPPAAMQAPGSASGVPTMAFSAATSLGQAPADRPSQSGLGQDGGGFSSFPPPPPAYPDFAFDHPGAPRPGKQKRSWTTAALAAATMAGLLLGGVLGGVTGFALGGNEESPSAYEQTEDPSTTQPNISDPRSPGQNTAVQQGTPVKSAPGVVLVNSAYDTGEGAGTGMIIDKSGIVLTNYHVVHGSSKVNITNADTKAKYTATVVGHNASRDIAVLKIDNPPKNLQTVKISTKSIKKGDSVSAVGNGSGQGYLTSLDGKVTGTDLSINAQDSLNSEDVDKLEGLIQTDADVVQGYSGGPLMNSKNEVVGVTTAASTGRSSEEVNGYAIPIDKAMEIVNKVKSGKGGDGTIIGRNAALGVTISTNKAGGQGGTAARGVIVKEVLEGSGAEKAGIEANDIVTHINGEEIDKASDLSDAVQDHKVGDEVTLKVIKPDGTEKDVKVTLGESSVN